MKARNIVIIIFIYFIILFLFPQENAGAEEALSLKAAVGEAKGSNPEIVAAKRTYEAVKARVPQELAPDDPMLEYSYDEMRAGVEGLMGKPMRSYAISQTIPFPTKLILRSRIASKDARISYEGYREKERDVISRTKSAWLDLWAIEKIIDITKESQALLEQFASSAAARYSLGKTSQQDALKAQVELAKIKNSLITLVQRREIAQARLNILLNRDPRSGIIIEKDLKKQEIAAPLDELSNKAKELRPQLRAFRYAVEKGKAQYLLAWNEFLPDLSGRYEQMIVNGRGDKWAGMLGVSVPIWFWEKQSFGVAQMKKELDMFKAEYKTMENMALFEVKEAYAKVEARKKLVEQFETSFIPQAEQALKASLIGYEANQIDFLNLLDSQRMLLDIKIDYYDTLVELEMAKAELEKAVGIDL
ncbi:MAG: TolC family protein [Candidatus Omnitrophica bacterium]|nr:TolC family protein [Candidatus Omnitrophota bacterium]